ncbi:MAG: autotransporter-associated beta strand repeat-containing protein, partial [Burkholderiales bacterium]|nr:autotransporter-associated beta strand repeat-containing protein [Burkholderiales bacterium]
GGSGTLTKTTTGTVILTGANTYTGNTTISAGTLQVGNGGTSGSLNTGFVSNSGILVFNRSDDLTFSAITTGPGALTKLGAGVLALTGANTYSGGTTLAEGTLAVTSNSALGNGTVTITGGTLLGTANVTLANTLALSGSPTIAAQTGTTLTVGGGGSSMAIGTALTIGTADATGAVLWAPTSGVSGNASSSITIAGGTFKAASGFVDNLLFPADSLQVNAGATLDIAGFQARLPTTLSGAGRITSSSGSPTLHLRGGGFGGAIDSALRVDVRSGITTLTGTNTYGGGTTIMADATLQLGDGGMTGSIAGNVTNDGTLAFNRSDGMSFAGAISGAGTLRKQGGGTLTLGPATTAVGHVDVAMGTLNLPTGLVVTGSVTNQGGIAANGTLTIGGSLGNAGVLTLTGATLNGTGTLANHNLLSGFGSIGGSGGFANYGQITPTGGGLTLANTGANVNYGNWDVPAGLPLALSSVTLTNAGVVNLAGGLISGNGTLVNGPDGTLAGRGSITAALSNQGVLALTGGTLAVAGAFGSSGQIQLSSSTALLSGGALANSGRIDGFGRVNNAVNNSGTIESFGGVLTMAGGVTNSGMAQARSGTLVFNSALANAAGGIIAADAGARVVAISGLSSNAGQIQLSGGTFDNNGAALTNAASGVVSGYGTLRSGAIANDGRVLLSGGTSAVYANLVSNGGSQIVLSGNSNTTFHGTVEVRDGAELRVSQGSVATFFAQVNQRNGAILTGTGAKNYEAGFAVGNSPGLGTDPGNVTFGSANVYEAEIGGTNPGVPQPADLQFDRYVVNGTLTFGGTLKVVQVGGYAPQAGNSFDLFDWGTRAGQFAALDFSAAPLAGGLAWDTSNLYVDGTLSVAAVPEPGSYAMMLAGLGLIGFTAVRRRAAKAA